jgi:microsomal epoxide hydrolase
MSPPRSHHRKPDAQPASGPRRGWLRGAASRAALGVLGAQSARAAARGPGDGAPPAVPLEGAAAPDAGLARRLARTSDGVRLSVIEHGPSGPAATGGPTIVFLPGWCMPASIWSGQIRHFGERWPVMAVDPRGQGLSEVPSVGYTADRRADDIRDLLGERRNVVLVGWSLGALEALHYVHRHGSARLGALALVDSSIGEPPVPPSGRGFQEALRGGREQAIDGFIRAMFARPPAPALVAQIRASALRMPLESSLALLNYPLPREHWRAIVHAFDRPLAYLVTPQFREQSLNLRRARPAARIEVFESAGHALFVDDAPRFNAVLGEWIDAGPA